jgi:hypothetical protein
MLLLFFIKISHQTPVSHSEAFSPKTFKLDQIFKLEIDSAVSMTLMGQPFCKGQVLSFCLKGLGYCTAYCSPLLGFDLTVPLRNLSSHKPAKVDSALSSLIQRCFR